MEARELKDDELVAQAREWRRRALRGDKTARGIAHELEREARHRFGLPKSDVPLPEMGARRLAELPLAPEKRWKFW
ncbi:MAG: hypothetical protein QM740_20265 [Acidovorax sp.]